MDVPKEFTYFLLPLAVSLLLLRSGLEVALPLTLFCFCSEMTEALVAHSGHSSALPPFHVCLQGSGIAIYLLFVVLSRHQN